jgi:O-acetyl-ADP-ribose deacetylase (regulator of RNase III)
MARTIPSLLLSPLARNREEKNGVRSLAFPAISTGVYGLRRTARRRSRSRQWRKQRARASIALFFAVLKKAQPPFARST